MQLGRRVIIVSLLLLVLAQAPAGATSTTVLTLGGPVHTSVPLGFVGLSLETSALGAPVDDPTVSNLPDFLEHLGTGTIRFGGSSVDEATLYEPSQDAPLPRWATSAVTPTSLSVVAALARATQWKIDLGVNLYHFDPARAAAEVAAATSALGGSLDAVAIGNEPELYTYMYEQPVSYEQYLANWSATRRAIEALVPGTVLAGPDFYLSAWLGAYATSGRRGLGSLSSFAQHYYPFSDCNGHGVTAGQLLGSGPIASEDSMIRTIEALAAPKGIPAVFDEFNSVSCGSSAPVQHEQASALWGVHALLEAARRGLGSVDVQTNLTKCNSYTPLCLTDPADPSSVSPRPIYRAMELVAGLEGMRFDTLTGSLPPRVSAYALSGAGGRTSIVIDNASRTPLTDLSLAGLGADVVSSVETMGTGDPTSSDDPGLVTTAPASVAAQGLDVPAGTTQVITLLPSQT